MLRTLLEHRDALKINSTQAMFMTNTLHTLDGIVSRGAITPDERTAVVRVARLILISLF